MFRKDVYSKVARDFLDVMGKMIIRSIKSQDPLVVLDEEKEHVSYTDLE